MREATPEEIRERIRARQAKAQAERNPEVLRSAIIAVLGHVDAGKTKLLDNIRRSNVQGGEAGGITQQIGATFVPREEILNRSKTVKKAQSFELKLPGLLVIDTPGHESFHNLRSRGSSLCDLAVLVVDILSGLEKQTIESLEMLRDKRVPFVIALNKVDRLNEWIAAPNSAIQNSLKRQKQNTMQHFDTQVKMVQLQLAERGLNTALYWDNKDDRNYVNIIPTSAVSGEGLPDLLFMLSNLPQRRLADKLAFSSELECTVLEVKMIAGHGCTIDAVLTQGTLREGDTVIMSGLDGPICTTVRSLLMPQPLKESRVKNEYETYPEVRAAQGLKIAAKDLESAVAGLPLVVAHHKDEVSVLMEEAASRLKSSLNAIKLASSGIAVQASTLGSLEAMLAFLKGEKIPVAAIGIGPVHKRHVIGASIQMEKDGKYGVMLAFDVPVDRDAELMAQDKGLKLFSSNIIYQLFDQFKKHTDDYKNQQREKYRHLAVFPCKLRILPDCIFNTRDPIVVGVVVEDGVLKQGAPLSVPSKGIDIGVVESIESNHVNVDRAMRGQEVCIKIDAAGGDKRMLGRHFELDDPIYSKISRETIDVCKNYFRDDLSKDDWRLMKQLKEEVYKFI